MEIIANIGNLVSLVKIRFYLSNQIAIINIITLIHMEFYHFTADSGFNIDLPNRVDVSSLFKNNTDRTTLHFNRTDRLLLIFLFVSTGNKPDNDNYNYYYTDN